MIEETTIRHHNVRFTVRNPLPLHPSHHPPSIWSESRESEVGLQESCGEEEEEMEEEEEEEEEEGGWSKANNIAS